MENEKEKDIKAKKKSEYIVAIILITLPIVLGIIILIIGVKSFDKFEKTNLKYDKIIDNKLKEEKDNKIDEDVDDKLNENIEIKYNENAIANFEKGDIIEFSGKEWVIINKTKTAVGVILKDYISSRIFCTDMKTRYSLKDKESLLYYLNEYFIKNLEEEKIAEYDWEVGPYRNEKSKIVTAKVGLLTKTEFLDLEMSGLSEKFRLTDGNAWWLLTPSAGVLLEDAVNIVTTDNRISEGWINSPYAVKPVIYILNDTEIEK